MLLPILMSFQSHEEEDSQHMLTMDQEKKLTHYIKITITRKISVKEISMKKFMELLLLILMSFQFLEEDDKLLMQTMVLVKNLIH